MVQVGNPKYVPRFSGEKRELVQRSDTIQYVPILTTLEILLQNEGIVYQIDRFPERIRTDGKIEDFCDGALYKTHPLFSTDHSALQIIAYYDNIELCNPLGTHVKQHKLGIVFFFFGKCPPKISVLTKGSLSCYCCPGKGHRKAWSKIFNVVLQPLFMT